ncbi:MAG TPA: Asp-tRNA(Asn)/Glu-tRNA(Gln) amidotransferase subunit GatC [Candidatus Lachnoclostridium pullistercoris]|uniref:Aspartyl/glutamyl-tRNA(Asn/Gln) amidotransferase subunit C n=1 Tax=Candidatus Lachnoclostridium pullistercoris TaxID=2838632 RepID=A0A9D2PC56_9FIRM|nr:Asp-tRNA(Asn)/Glu-tRNA(Gln) amidotransferase subunit GatC [Candidatus Lachnoclostridium pullistercoris]
MSRKIDEATMENVLVLAKLKLSAGEREQAAAEMERMLDYVEKMNELDTSATEPMVHPCRFGNVFREDEVTNGSMREELLSIAPEQEQGQYAVPKTVE